MRVRYRPPQAAEKIGATVSTLAKWRVYGIGPKFEKLGPKLVVYSEESLEEFLSERSHASTSEYQTNPGSGRPKRQEENGSKEERLVEKQRVNGKSRVSRQNQIPNSSRQEERTNGR